MTYAIRYVVVISVIYSVYGDMPVVARWRDDLRCGPEFQITELNTTSECDPYSNTPCCSPYGWCGSTQSHCHCAMCNDYRKRLDRITVTMVTPTVIAIAWISPQELIDPLYNITLDIEPLDGSMEFPLTIQANITEFVYENLVPNTEYNITIHVPTNPPRIAALLQKTDRDPCSSNPCKNATATCTAASESCFLYECFCEDPVNGCFVGEDCDRRYDPCNPNPCWPGTCERDDLFCSETCICPDCYTGRYCEQLLKPCDPNPCNGGICAQQGRSCFQYTCICPECYNGRNCETYIEDVCQLDNPCRNNGTCHPTNNSCSEYTCECPECITGDVCHQEVNPCSPNPCLNDGKCVAMNDSCVDYTCQCGQCYAGEHCSNYTSLCDFAPCLNGGTCIPDDTDCTAYICNCQGLWFWTNCAWNIGSAIIAGEVFIFVFVCFVIVVYKRRQFVRQRLCTLWKPEKIRTCTTVKSGDSDDLCMREMTGHDVVSSIDWSIERFGNDGSVLPIGYDNDPNLEARTLENTDDSPTCSDITRNFFTQTSWHGLPQIARANQACSRIFWTVLLVIAIILVTAQLSLVIKRFFNYPILIKVEELPESVLLFPAVTVCNTNKVRSSALARSKYSPLVAIMKEAQVFPYYVPCLHGDFLCNDQINCIKSYGVCDGEISCPDASDEFGCDYSLFICSEGEFKCSKGGFYGICVDASKVCDGIDDCIDAQREDENPEMCGNTQRRDINDDACQQGFRCDMGICHPNIHRCDYKTDCKDKMDEVGCRYRKCQEWEYACDNKKCIIKKKVCDWVDDCGDGSDEVQCIHNHCENAEFSCNNGQCIDNWKVCNGYTDCIDKSDEEANCTDVHCVDNYEACPYWAAQGECSQNSLFMKSRCQLSCGICVGKQVVVGNDGECPSGFFKCRSGYCIESIRYCNNEQECDQGEDEYWPLCVHTESAEIASPFHEGWQDEYLDITEDSEQLFDEFQEYYYTNPGFDRVGREDPADWKDFVTFSSTPDYSDLRNVLKLTAEEIREYGHQFEDFILQCTFNGAPCDPGDFVTIPNEHYGNCFIFNADLHEQKKSTRSGGGSGLLLTVFTEQEEYLGMYGQESGVRIVIHQPMEVPSPEEEGMTAKTGSVTSFAIKKSVAHRLQTPYGQDCKPNVPDDEGFLYSRKECQVDCLHKYMYIYCGCLDTFAGSPRCLMLNKTQGPTTKKYSFHQPQNKKYNKSPECYEEDLASDIGGLLGLYIGISTITIFESFDFLFDVIRLCLHKTIYRKRASRPPQLHIQTR
uniref:Uncharacterized protein LOC100366994 n=1 Tax=Saccoglossus kowalevskii TaxID=10224 RepID=A0ABM0MYR2_SACKO|nr:PREDICTED: uncharacterized protein LOC100366994 [Saccoglossus kowalevskii]